MTSLNEIHVYQRELVVEKRTSLSLLVGMVNDGSHVLDVGIGGGALGAFLTQNKHCVVDGVTYNAEEAALAGAHYRCVQVADLDVRSLADLFGARRYHYIICADVLEHLRDPARVLEAARGLLEAGGRLLISVPNVAYMGLIAELLGGDFRYRREGLLDQTHVRFFTRDSLLRFLADHGWHAQRLEAVELDVADSEFAPALAALPPAVRKQLLADPQGLNYQYVLEATPCLPGDVATPPMLSRNGVPMQAHYVLQLYCADAQGYREENKVSARAQIGQDRQTVVFDVPPMAVHRLRLDPSDRPGLVHLYAMELFDAAGQLLWAWDGDASRLQQDCHQVVVSKAWLGERGGALLMVGDDPQLHLTLADGVLAAAGGGRLHVTLSWPMSADYWVLAERTAPLVQELAVSVQQLSVAAQRLHDATQQRDAAQTQAQELERAWQAQREESQRLEQALAAAQVQNQQKDAAHRDLGATHAALHAEHERTRNELMRLADTVSAAQAHARRCQAEREDVVKHMDAIQNSTLFRVTRPLVQAKTRLDQWRRGTRPNADASDIALPVPLVNTVDVIVPVYRSLSDTQCCVESVLSAQTKTPFRLVMINDRSPEPEVTAYLRTLPARDARVLVLENEENLGFVGTVNRGMALDEQRDVLLLNSDAEVANDWLDRIQAAAYAAPRISSVTPLSNNATICSYPRFCQANDIPQDCDTAALDRLCRQTNPGLCVDVPTGVGFCMYIRRESLAEVGLFDTANFGKGYGEENDFCMRSHKAGWRHVLALDTFVRHAGGVSFGDAKTPREREAVEKLRRLHPTYDGLVHAHVSADPARVARLRIDLARIRAQALPAILAVTHSRGGGTERHVRELADVLQGKALCFALKPMPDGSTELSWVGQGEAFSLAFRLPADFDTLVDVLRGLGVAHVHIHHLIGHDPCIWGLAERLGVRFDYTVHDYYAVCPQISLTDGTDRYCGEQGLQQCRNCVQRTPAPGGVGIEAWRGNFSGLLNRARHVLTPSVDTAQRMARYLPGAAVRVVPHKDLRAECAPPHPVATGARPLRVVILGALSPIKGADVVESVAKLAAESAAPLEFHLLGYAYRPLQTQPKAHLTVHGSYDDTDLDSLLAWLKPDLVWFPAQWPETYSYTLSACLKAALPVVVPDIGAFAERISGRSWSWACPWASTAKEWLTFFNTVRTQYFETGVAPAAYASGLAIPAPFDYRTDYLQDVALRAVLPEVPDAVLAQHSDLRPTGMAAIGHGLRGQALSVVVRIRHHPALRQLARWVPLAWQTRLKLWLLK